MNITDKWIRKHKPCSGGLDWLKQQNTTDAVRLLRLLIKEKRYNWANWTIVRLFSTEQKILYAIFTAESVLPEFEKKYPKDSRPRNAIEAAKAYLKNPCKKTKAAAAYAAGAAGAASAAAYAADADVYATNAATNAADADDKKTQIKILNYGLKLLGAE